MSAARPVSLGEGEEVGAEQEAHDVILEASMAKQLKSSAGRRFSLYWCTTSDGDEDWFVVANSGREARRFHENAEGYERGDARAERTVALPAELHADGDGRTVRRAGSPEALDGQAMV
jgi:hypothetical protein